MTDERKMEITRIAKEFASGFTDTIDTIAGSGFLIVDPLSGYLNAIGIKNTLTQLPANNDRPQVLIMTFEDGSNFIPAGSDLKREFPEAQDWMWVNTIIKSKGPSTGQ